MKIKNTYINKMKVIVLIITFVVAIFCFITCLNIQ